MQSRIHLRVSNQKAYVWDVDDIAKLRSEHRICGILTGTLPHLSQQNVFLGPPLVLMPEEVVLLVEKELAILVDDPPSHGEPSIPELQRWEDGRKDAMNQQFVLAQAKVAKEVTSGGRAMTEAAIQKRREREERKLKRIEQVSEAEEISMSPSMPLPRQGSPTHPKPCAETPESRTEDLSSTSLSYTIIVPAASSTLEWYHPSGRTHSDLGAAKAAGIWSYPETSQERARCAVFRGLWEKGYFLGNGIKFGGDYLVYPGDPLRYHSHFVATVLESPASTLRPMEIVAHGRLGTATKKAHLLCGWDEENRNVSYYSIEWAGFG